VGKTTLAQEFARDKDVLFFTALEQADHDNLVDFTRKMMGFFELPILPGSFSSWTEALEFFAERATGHRCVLVFDEFPYAAERNRSLPSALQAVIDHKLKETGTFVILCGSNQGFMESEVLGSKSPLYGRRTAQIRLLPLGYREAARMLPGLEAQEAFRYYACFGGVPYYLSLVDTSRSLRENVARLYFDQAGFLYDEPLGLLRQELSEPAAYNSILRAVAGGANRQARISDATGIPATSLPKYLATLCSLGMLRKAVPFGESVQTSRRGIYRIDDACYAFWYRFVMPRVSDIEAGLGEVAVRSIPEQQFDDYCGHRFEGVCAEWMSEKARARALPIAATSVGSWWGTNPEVHEQTDIDVLAADRSAKELILGECKYRESFDETAAIEDLKAKDGLISGYTTEAFFLFSKHPVSAATKEKYACEKNIGLLALDELYG
jgi:AAA+ ATPase superfamily predicted ATPase